MNWLKKAVINSGAPKTGVIDILRGNMGGSTPARDHKVVHASDITKSSFCPRKLALMDLLDVKLKNEYISTALQATFDIGRATAKLVVEEWMTPYAIGNWKCIRCGDQRTMCSKPESSCKHGGKCLWEYREPEFLSQEYGVSGSLDVLASTGGKWLVVELKIIRVEDFDSIIVPLPEHRIRTSLYLKLISDSNSPWKNQINLHEARVFYVSRGYGKKHPVHQEILPFKEFVVERDDQVYERPLKMAKQIKLFRDPLKGQGDDLEPYGISGPMPSGVCSTALDKLAKTCQVCAACFSGKYLAEQEPL